MGPKDEHARQLYDEGAVAGKDQEWGIAREKFEASFEIEAKPATLFALAQATRNSLGCREAVPLFQRFARMVPEGGDAYEYAREAIVDCASELAEEPVEEQPTDEAATLDPLPPPVEPGPAQQDDKPPRRSRKDRPWHRDPLGGVLVGVGAATAAAGGAVLITAQVQSGQDAPDYGTYAQRVDRIEAMRIAGGVVLGVGGALLIGGVVRWAVLGARESKKRGGSRASVTPVFGPRGASLNLHARF